MRTRWIVAALLAATGLVFTGQGLGILRGSSAMVDDVRWAIVGVVMVVLGAALAWTAVRNRPSA